jgi:quercetin dioxygenase-like cupin family protein
MSSLNLNAAADDLLGEATAAPSGRAARTLTPGAGAPLKQTLLALGPDATLADHTAPGPATLVVLRGTVGLRSGDAVQDLVEGDWVVVPSSRHSLHAGKAAVVLLTVAAAAGEG